MIDLVAQGMYIIDWLLGEPEFDKLQFRIGLFKGVEIL